jgi:hypothetical protein
MIEYLEIEGPTTGKKIQYRANFDAREFIGRPGLAWIIMANVNLSTTQLLDVMAHYGIYRKRSWVERRRWIYFDADYVRQRGAAADADGQQARAYRIMDQHPHVSARELARILGRAGIKRSKDWVLKHRVHELPSATNLSYKR